MSHLEKLIQQKARKPLIGTALYQYNPIFLDMIAPLGFDVVWIEMEHMPITISQAADLCRMASGAGLTTMIRIPDTRRDNVLRAAECGPDIIDVPMANSPEVMQELVRHARYAPEGNRGFFGSSRAVRYGLADGIAEEQRRVNDHLCLMAQIETQEAVDKAEELCSVEGINTIFLGLGDLSASMGFLGAPGHPEVKKTAEKVITIARSCGKSVALAGSPSDAKYWGEKGVDLLFCASDVMCLKMGAQAIIEQTRG